MTDLAQLAEELAWLKANPAFEERPASLEEFLGPDYLNIRDKIRKRIIIELREIMGPQVSGIRPTAFPEAMITGGIGIGKTTVASVVLPYLAHWVLCLKDPQDFYDLLPGSRIAFMQMSTSEKQALEVVFGDIKARIKHSPWFQKHPYDTSFKNQLRFEKDVWIIPGDSSDLTFEGYNILGGIIDEADSHKVTQTKDYAEDGFNAISNRITSRFQDKGFLLIIGQMKQSGGFAARKFEEFKLKSDAYAVRLAIWDSMGDEFEGYEKDADGKTLKFAYDTKRKQIMPEGVVNLVGMIDQVLWIPILYKRQFKNNPEKALRDLAGMPPAVNDPFISLVSKIDAARDRWIVRYPGFKSPIAPDGRLEPWFKAHETIKRTLHIDLAYSGDGDALGMAMGHVPQMVDINGERKPYIVIDLLLRIKALPGGEIFLGDVRNWVYMLRDQLKFKIDVVTMDGFECLTGDTLVPCLDGTTRTMRELAENYPDGGVWTYSFNGSKIVPGRMKRAWRTATKKTIRVILDNGEQVRCTPDHPFMLRDGSYRSAVDLRYGDSLMPLYRRVTPGDWKGLRGYEQVLQPGPRTISSRHLREKGEWLAGRWQFTHRMVAGSVPKDHIDHHVDFNKLNNNPGNLRRMLLEDHLILHREHGSANFRRLWADDEFRQKTTEAIRKAMTGRTGIIANRRRHDVTIEMLQQQAHLSRREVTKRFGWSQDMIYARVREAGFNSWSEFRKSRLTQVNHKVIAVVDLNEIEDVYDLEIEDHHNFAIGSGIFVHNSTDTMQQLQRKRFHADYVSVDKQILPYHDLREALYEDRIDFPPYICNIHMESGSQPVEILVKELTELMDTGRKIDHPLNGSKDVADAVAGVTFTLMGDRRYHRNTASLETAHASQGSQRPAMAGASHPAFRGESGFSAPLPPNLTGRW